MPRKPRPGVDIWPQRIAFRAAMEDYQAREGLKRAQVATKLGVGLGTLNNAYRPEARIGIDVLVRAAGLFGVSVATFLDDAGAPPPGASGESTEIDRFLLRLIGDDLASMSDDQKQAAFGVWRAAVAAYKLEKK